MRKISYARGSFDSPADLTDSHLKAIEAKLAELIEWVNEHDQIKKAEKEEK